MRSFAAGPALHAAVAVLTRKSIATYACEIFPAGGPAEANDLLLLFFAAP